VGSRSAVNHRSKVWVFVDYRRVSGNAYSGATLPASALADDCGACNDCSFMKLTTVEKIYAALKNERPEIFVEETIRKKAEKSILRILRMLELSK
jgi:quinolinate synthase